MKGAFYTGLVSSLAFSAVFFVGSHTAMASVASPRLMLARPSLISTPLVSTITGTITAIDSQTGAESITVLPKATERYPNPSASIVHIDSSTYIQMIGESHADVSNLAVGYRVLVTEPQGSTFISVDPNDKPVETLQNEPAP